MSGIRLANFMEGTGGGRRRHFDNGEGKGGGRLFDNVLLDLPDFSVS